MSAVAFADGENTGSSAYKSDGYANNYYAKVDDNTFSIKKEIFLFNTDNSAILDPNVVFTYEVSHVDVTDGTPAVTGIVLDDNNSPLKQTTAVVKDGIANAVTIQGRKDNAITGTDGAAASVTGASGATTTLTFGGDNATKLTTLDEGATVESTTTAVTTGYIDVTVNAATIYAAGKGPGIYRYKISDTTTAATLKNAGITRADGYVTDLYLDVYVKNNDNDPVDGYVVYGYVLHKGDKDVVIKYANGTAESVKVDGYTVLSEVTKADQYHTYNVEVTKTPEGAPADTRNNFPFQVALANASITSLDDFYYVVTTDGTAGTATSANLDANGAWSLGDATTNTGALNFQNGDGILITGLPVYPDTTPVYTTITVTERNNTFDTYTASAADEDDAVLKVDNNASPATVNADSVVIAREISASLNAVKAIDNADAKDVVAFTNTIEVISPTGVALRVAPYVAILCGGIVLLVISRKRRAEEE